MARAGRRELVDVDEEALLGITRVEGKHTVVNVLLDALAAVARSQCATGSASVKTRFNALSLSVVVDILDDHAPLAVYVAGTNGPAVKDITRADVTLISNPVALVERVSVVKRIVKVVLLNVAHSVHQVVGRLIGDICVLLQDEGIVFDSVLD